jgi:hypothetical protein
MTAGVADFLLYGLREGVSLVERRKEWNGAMKRQGLWGGRPCSEVRSILGCKGGKKA